MRMMHRLAVSVAIGAGAIALTPAAFAGKVEVVFVAPERFTDAGGKGGTRDVPTKAAVLREIQSFLVSRGARLPATQELKVEILDLDIAGRRDVLGGGAGEDVRVFDQMAFPRINLRYALIENGQALASGEDRLTNPSYLDGLSRAPSGDPIRYERALLNRWFNARFGAHKGS